MAVCLCAIWPFTALAAESDPVKIERVKLKFESFRPKDGYVKITNLGTGYSVGDCEIINDSDIDNWNSSYCARLQIELTADDGYEFRKKENRILTSKVPIFTVMSPAITTIKK